MSALDELARRLRSRTDAITRPLLTGTTTPSSSNGGMKNPMRRFGSMIRGGQDGAPVEILPGLEGQVLTMIDGRPQWRYPTLAGMSVVTRAGNPVVTRAGAQVITRKGA